MPSPMIGEVRMFAFGRAPIDWLLCDGSIKQINDYDLLFTVLGTTYGGDGVTTFALPDMRGRVPVHQGQGVSGSGAMTNRYLGVKGGSETVTLQVAHIPAHTHAFEVSGDQANNVKPDGALLAKPVGDNIYVKPENIKTAAPLSTADATTSITGASTPHENTMPTLTLSYCICARGYFPSRA
ncbi:microcystin-dependent protein [Herbaspirillum sp. CF444]|uniref:phage tail protein n=1 Tax=Herbaspirillum sp. CF444 TaxID=1144319 RepID=UPI000272333F|nr:tail fiber protein [Herbaspirillum sp. CF444]EJL94400.1 microcystin-dependent protein [Herbaspirillum sp. CF444]